MRGRERRNDDPGEAHAADDRPEQHRGVRVLVGTVARPGNLSFLSLSLGLFIEIKRLCLLASSILSFLWEKSELVVLLYFCALFLSLGKFFFL